MPNHKNNTTLSNNINFGGFMKINKIETIKLIGGHALIMGHRPEKITLSKMVEKLEKDGQEFSKLGLFDSSTPNYTTYYPDVTVEDLIPKDNEFIEPVFRLLSNVTVQHGYNPIHFPVDVLKQSMYKLIGQTINIDHETALGNAIGTVKSVEWQNAYTKDGIKVPAGINGVLKIDGKSNPRIARGIMMDPPSIHSESVTVNFQWVKSHPNMSDEEFRNKLGTVDEKGKLIEKVASKIIAYHEISLVGHGADPFAQKIGKDGKIVNIKYAGSRTGQLSDDGISGESMAWDWKDLPLQSFNGVETILNSYTEDENLNNNNEQNQLEMEGLLRLFETMFGLTVNSLTAENHKAELAKFKTGYDAIVLKASKADEPITILGLSGVVAIEKEINDLRSFKETVPANLSELQSLASVATTVITELRDDTKRLYKLSLGDKGKEDTNIITIINAADYKSLTSLHKQYNDVTEGLFEFVCECGSHNVTRASAKGSKGSEEFVEKSTQEVIEHFTTVTGGKKGFLQ